MGKFLRLESSFFDFDTYEDVIDVFENYAIAPMIVGNSATCVVRESDYFEKNITIDFLIVNHKSNPRFLFTAYKSDDIKECKPKECNLKIVFNSDEHDSSLFKKVLTDENYSYVIDITGNCWEYHIHLDNCKFIEQVDRLLKLFERYI